MKGTIFSADFVFDNSGNARLLEINTDTDLINNATDVGIIIVRIIIPLL